MNRKLATQDLATLFAERSGMDMKSSMAFVKAVFEIVQEYVAKDKLVKIKGFGTFKLVSVSDRESINVNTGERIVISGHTKLSFTPDSALKDAVNRPFADFETTLLNDATPLEEMERIPANDNAPIVLDVQESVSDDIGISVSQEGKDSQEDCLVQDVGSVVHDDVIPSIAPASDKAENVEHMSLPAEKNSVEELPEIVDQPDSIVSAVTESESESVPSYPMASDNMVEQSENVKHHRWIYVIFTIILMTTSYLCGYYRVLDRLDITLQRDSSSSSSSISSTSNNSPQSSLDSAVSLTDTIFVESDSIHSDTVMQMQSSPVEPKENFEEMAKLYPQVKDGEYWIVGDAGRVHYMQVGETLYRIAGKELGDQKLIRYLIVFNDFKDPNVLHKDQPIRIPRLVRKSQPSDHGTVE